MSAAAHALALHVGRMPPSTYSAHLLCADLKKAWSVPTHMTARKGSVQQIQAAELLHALAQHSIDSRASLAKAWQTEPGLLQRQLSDCLRKGKQHVLVAIWPQALTQAAQVAKS